MLPQSMTLEGLIVRRSKSVAVIRAELDDRDLLAIFTVRVGISGPGADANVIRKQKLGIARHDEGLRCSGVGRWQVEVDQGVRFRHWYRPR